MHSRLLGSFAFVALLAVGCGSKDKDKDADEPIEVKTSSAKPKESTKPADTTPPASTTPAPAETASATPSASAATSSTTPTTSAAPVASGTTPPATSGGKLPSVPPGVNTADAAKKAQCIASCAQRNMAKGMAPAAIQAACSSECK